MRLILITMAGLLALVGIARAEPGTIPTLVLKQGDAVRATIEINPESGSYVMAVLTPAKREELARFTRGNIGKTARLVVGDKVIVESVVREEVNGPVLQYPVESPEAALETVWTLFASHPK